LTYSLVIFGTFLTRSGVLPSVHAFAQSAIGPAFFAFIGLTLIGSIALLIHRWPELRGETEMKSMLSREALFLLNNLLFMSILVVCFWGVIFPLISELVTGQKVTVGPPFYNRATAPLFASLLLLMGIAPLSAWGISALRNLGRQIWRSALIAAAITAALYFTYTRNVYALIGFYLVALVLLITLQEFWRAARARMRSQKETFFGALWTLFGRDPRRYGGYIVHISMMLMAIGIMGINLFQKETQATLAVDDSMTLGGYRLQYRSIAQFEGADQRQVTRAVLDVYDSGGNYLDELHPRIDYYADAQQNMTIPGQHSTMRDDLYVILIDWQPTSATGATFKVYVNPLVNWLWIGALVFLVGILVAAWPRPEMVTVRAAQTVVAEAAHTGAGD
jgi:cytochrome c-type biogenesis protein CcmF